MPTRTRTPNATRTRPQRLSFSPLAIPRQRRPNFTLSVTQPPHLSILVPPPGFAVSDPPQPQEQTWVEVTRKGGKGKKNTTAAQVTASSTSSVHQGPSLLPAAQRRLFALRLSPTLPNNSLILTASLPDIMAAVLKDANWSLPLSLTASVNRNGAVTLAANPYTPSPAYSPFFDAMTKKLQQSFPVGDNQISGFQRGTYKCRAPHSQSSTLYVCARAY